MANQTNFLLNTDYEMDKIIYFKDGEIDANEYSVTIKHGLSFTPLIFGVCSFNSDFSDPRTIPYTYSTQSSSVSFSIQADSTNITIGFTVISSGPDKAYYRIYAFEPSDSKARVGTTVSHAKEFVLNTDYNYCKLFKKGILDGDAGVAHNLGYIPQVLAWQENGGVIVPIDTSLPSDPISSMPRYIAVTNSAIGAHGYDKVHYRIYYDEE